VLSTRSFPTVVSLNPIPPFLFFYCFFRVRRYPVVSTDCFPPHVSSVTFFSRRPPANYVPSNPCTTPLTSCPLRYIKTRMFPLYVDFDCGLLSLLWSREVWDLMPPPLNLRASNTSYPRCHAQRMLRDVSVFLRVLFPTPSSVFHSYPLPHGNQRRTAPAYPSLLRVRPGAGSPIPSLSVHEKASAFRTPLSDTPLSPVTHR